MISNSKLLKAVKTGKAGKSNPLDSFPVPTIQAKWFNSSVASIPKGSKPVLQMKAEKAKVRSNCSTQYEEYFTF